MLDRFTANLQFQGQALVLRAERQQVLASNIANADTPDYLARDFDFSQALRQAVAGGNAAPGRLPLPGGGTLMRTSGSGAELLWRMPDQPSLDGNTVDLDRERASFADNSLRYEATVRFINGSVRNMLSAIRGE